MKLFCVSDIHGYYDILIKSLHDAGFKENAPSNMLICCGDYWDRGNQPYEVMQYLMSLNNVVLVRGNHEDLMVEYLNRGYAERYDISNGTDQTFWNLSSKLPHDKTKALIPQFRDFIYPFYNKMVDYYETKNYVFVHGWIPIKHIYDEDKYFGDKKHDYYTEWREASTAEWEECRWLNGMNEAFNGNLIPNKTIVCGHWHCSYGWARKEYEETHEYDKSKEFEKNACWEPFKMDGIIAIDRCTAFTKEMNILILEDDLLE